MGKHAVDGEEGGADGFLFDELIVFFLRFGHGEGLYLSRGGDRLTRAASLCAEEGLGNVSTQAPMLWMTSLADGLSHSRSHSWGEVMASCHMGIVAL